MYSTIQIEDDMQLECLTCISTDWRLPAIRLLMSRDTLISNSYIGEGEFAFIGPPDQCNFDYLVCGAFRFVSFGLANFLKSRINAEFLEVGFLHSEKESNFRLLHMLERHSALDREQSVYLERSEELGGGVREVRKLVLLEENLHGIKSFILNETGMLFFDDRICQEIRDHGFRGLQFCPSASATFGC